MVSAPVVEGRAGRVISWSRDEPVRSWKIQRNLAKDRDSTVAADGKKRDLANHVAELALECVLGFGERLLERLERWIAREGDVRLVRKVAPQVRKERARVELVVQLGDGGR